MQADRVSSAAVIVESYVMHLYCTVCEGWHVNNTMGEFSGNTKGECRREARRTGWWWRGKKVRCPMHQRKHKEKHRAQPDP